MKTQPKTILDLTTGSVTKKLLAFTMPILASNLLQHLYNAADKAVVGNFATHEPLALGAIGATGSAITLLLNLFLGLSLGANVVCANMRGAQNTRDLRRAMHTSVFLAALAGLAAMILGLVITEPFLRLMSCPEVLMELAAKYMRIYFIGVPFSMLYNFGSAILRAHGDTRRPMVILSLSGLVNVGLNLVFVTVLGMDVDGVAWATVISQLLSAVAVLWILFKADGGFDLEMKEMKLHRRELKAIARVGIPCGLNGMVFSVANVTIHSAVNALGEHAVMGYSASSAITGLVYQVLAAFYSGCISFSGQCYGARLYKRIDRLVGVSILLCSVFMAGLSLVGTVFAQPLLRIFTDSPQAIAAGTPQLLITSWSYILYGISEVFLGTLRGMRRSGMPTLINAVCICLPRLAWVFFVFPFCREVWFLYLCYPISYVFSSTAQGLYFWRTRKKLPQ